MKVACYLPRNDYLRVFGPLIQHLLERSPRGEAVHVICPNWSISKPHRQLRAEDLHALFGDRVATHLVGGVEDFREQLERERYDVLLTYLPDLAELDQEEIDQLRAVSRRVGTKWMSLPYFYSQEGYLLNYKNTAWVLQTWDMIGTMGRWSTDYLQRETAGLPRATQEAIARAVRIVGYPLLDGIRHLPSASAIRAKYGLGSKPVIVVATAAKFYPLVSNAWKLRGSEHWFRGGKWPPSGPGLVSTACAVASPRVIPYREYLRALRRFADRNGALLVAKTRVKHQDPGYVHEYVDTMVQDGDFYPFSSLELLSVASLYVGFYSAMALEAITLGVPAVNCVFLSPELAGAPVWRPWPGYFLRQPGALFDVPGVSRTINGWTEEGKAAVARLAEATFDDYPIDTEAREGFLDRCLAYWRPDQPSSSEQVYRTMEELVAGTTAAAVG